jgi:M6 family metalloprotease-like protein
MKRILLSILIVIGIIYPDLSFARKMRLEKTRIQKPSELRNHPIERLLSGTGSLDQTSRDANKLLILLIDFQEDSDPQTTGNGKFIQDPTGYNMPLGKPPHDYQYFVSQSEVLYYYYDAVSYGSFLLDIDVYPQTTIGNFEAYTLPHEMAYYNPPGASQELMITRFEEYFQDAFTKADEDSTLDFSQYEHFMFIHAGADTQHDFNGNSPADIPSFFIQVGTGKEVTVDDDIIIDHACNVPEMITQDVDEIPNGEGFIFTNYGVINGVMVHEFGHSIGFADLYNVYNNTPQVGYYDIMDSGGSVALNFEYPAYSDSVYSLEGTYPALPGAWSRMMAFEDNFRARGILKDISEFDLSRRINILPAEKMFDATAMNDSTAYFVKIPLNDTEYLLVENRQSDPDGDGGSIPIWSSDYRVILAPSSMDEYDPNANYEYDWLLPGWLDNTEDAKTFGGGLVIWHIDNALLEENDNYNNNTVNTLHSRRAVKIIEADNIDDIGNQYSMYWQGTAYEPFFKYSPLLDEFGDFLGWDDDYILNPNGELEFIGSIASDELSSTSKPELASNNGDPSILSLFDISSYSIELNEERVMSFSFGIQSFDITEKIAEYDSISSIGHIGNTAGYPTFPLVTEDNLNYFSLIDENWADNFNVTQSVDFMPEFPIFPIDPDLDGDDEFQLIAGNTIEKFSPDAIYQVNYSENLSDIPMVIDSWLYPSYIVPTTNEITFYYGDPEIITSYPITNAKITFDGTKLIAATDNKIFMIPDPMLNGALIQEIDLPDYDPSCTPVNYVDMQDPTRNATFVQTKTGDIFRIQNGEAEEIFRLSPYTSNLPSQLALGDFNGISLIFGAEDRVFAIGLDGTLKHGFPAYLENKTIVSNSYPRIINFPDETVALLQENNGFVAVNLLAEKILKYSFYWVQQEAENQFYWDNYQDKLFYIFADDDSHLYSSYIESIDDDPIIWNGFRNNRYSLYTGTSSADLPITPHLQAYAFPNPAKTGEVRFKIIDARNNITLKIYDIAGNMLYKDTIEWNQEFQQDVRWNTTSISSGVYFAVVKTDGKVKKIPFAVVN